MCGFDWLGCAVMSDHEVKLTAAVVSGSASENADNGLVVVTGVLSAETQSLGVYAVPAQVMSSTPPPVPGPPVPVPYRG